MLEWNILFYVFDTCHIFNSDGRSELPRNIWSVQLPCQFLGVNTAIEISDSTCLYLAITKPNMKINQINPTLSGIWNGARYPGGGHYDPPLESARMKLQRHVRGQIRGSWVCPVHLDYFQFADMCISRAYTCIHVKYMCHTPRNGLVVFATPKNPHFDPSLSSEWQFYQKLELERFWA